MTADTLAPLTHCGSVESEVGPSFGCDTVDRWQGEETPGGAGLWRGKATSCRTEFIRSNLITIS